jgi:hypothetical protein
MSGKACLREAVDGGLIAGPTTSGKRTLFEQRADLAQNLVDDGVGNALELLALSRT